MDAFCDLEPIAPNYNHYKITLDEVMDVVGEAPPHQLLLRTSVLLTSLARILPETVEIKQAMNEIVADVRVAMQHSYEAGFASGFQLGLGQKVTATTNPRVA